MTTAHVDVMKEDGVTLADPFDFGAGHVDVRGQANKGSVLEPGLVYDAGLFEYAAFTCGAELSVFSSSACAFLESIGIPSNAYDLNLPSIGAAEVIGRKTIIRTVTSVAKENGLREYEAVVSEVPGFTVTVNPPKLRLRSGESATFEVEVVTTVAPLGEWMFGSLKWVDKTGNYEVKSSIALRAFDIGYPDEVAGSGADGSASLDVAFGYTGNYGAAPHGLEAATVIQDNVVQDPDQTFNPSDGFSNRHDFEVSDAAHLRIAMPPESVDDAAIDIDLFLFGPDGAFVAASTSPGTNELIDIALPADGNWTLFVHGWNTVGPNADYDTFVWAVPATPGGGNLSVESAPGSATLGEKGTVIVSWTGVAQGQWHLGAVSHTTDTSLRLTLVEVDNRGESGGASGANEGIRGLSSKVQGAFSI